jgi:hypothetical protein
MCDTRFCTIRLFLFASMAAATLHMLGQIHAEEPQNTVTRILEVWKKREASHTSFAFTWEVKGFPEVRYHYSEIQRERQRCRSKI